MDKTAIILAAGRGRRLKELTEDQPKPMVQINNKSIIANLVENLIGSGFTKIVILTGYKAIMLKTHLQRYASKIDLIFIENEVYATTNNIYTLWLAREHFYEGFYLFEADIFCDKSLLEKMANYQDENIIVADRFTNQMNGTVIKFDRDTKKVKSMFLGINQGANFEYADAYKTVNFYKFGQNYVQEFFLPRLKYHIECNNVDAYYELIVNESLDKNYDFVCLPAGDSKWWEIDDEKDLLFAREMFR